KLRREARRAVVRPQLPLGPPPGRAGRAVRAALSHQLDSHGGPGENLNDDFEKVCRQVDQPSAALILDLKQRGLLKDTLVIWGGEFGRTPMGEVRVTIG